MNDIAKEFSSAYERFMRASEEQRRTVFKLAKLGTLTQADIGKRLGISRQRVNQILHWKAYAARRKVAEAVKAGRLKPASSFRCVDCDKKATQYDHRDYGKRFLVEPVCAKCNTKRGPGANGGRPITSRANRLKELSVFAKLGGEARNKKVSKARMREIGIMGGKAYAAKMRRLRRSRSC